MRIHHICDMDKSAYRAPMRAAYVRLVAQHGWLKSLHAPHLDKPPDNIYPLGSSSVQDQRELTPRRREALQPVQDD